MNSKLLFFISMIIALSVHGQEYKFSKQVIYHLTYQPDSNDVGSTQHISMELLLNDRMSLFQSLKQRQLDSVLYFNNREYADVYSKVGGYAIRPVNKFSYKILKYNDKVHVFDSAFGLNIEGKDILYEYKEDIGQLAWELKADTIHIHGRVCQRADVHYGHRIWTAWFDPAIPISEGPYKFCGLPGLIIAITDHTQTWRFELVHFEEKEILHSINFQKWYVVQKKEKEQLYKDRMEFQQNLPLLMKDAYIGSSTTKILDNYAQALKKDNNWIELYP